MREERKTCYILLTLSIVFIDDFPAILKGIKYWTNIAKLFTKTKFSRNKMQLATRQTQVVTLNIVDVIVFCEMSFFRCHRVLVNVVL